MATKDTVTALPSLEEITAELEKQQHAKENEEAGVPVDNETVTHKQVDPKADVKVAPTAEVVAEAAGDAEVETEETVEAPVVELPKRDPQAAKFAALSRRDREIRQREQEFDRKQTELADKLRALDEREAKAKAISNPLDALKHHGFSYQDATHTILGQPLKDPDPVADKLKASLDPLAQRQAELDDRLKRVDEQLNLIQQDRMEVANRELRYSIQVTAEKEGYEYIGKVGEAAIDLVQETMTEYWKAHKRVLSYKDACDRVERHYEESLDKLMGATKSQTRYAPTKQAVSTKLAPTSAPAKTLTQSLTQGVRTKPNLDDMSPAEAKAYLAKTVLKYKQN